MVPMVTKRQPFNLREIQTPYKNEPFITPRNHVPGREIHQKHFSLMASFYSVRNVDQRILQIKFFRNLIYF